ncbi:hypothetical protein PS6_004369 [Mucor atramentarius]
MEDTSNERPKMNKSTSQKTLPPIPFDDIETNTNEKTNKSLGQQSSPNALKELDILLREPTPEGEPDRELNGTHSLSDSEEDSLDDDEFDFNQLTFDEVDGNELICNAQFEYLAQ